MTQPTAGVGQTSPRPRRAKAIAARICAMSFMLLDIARRSIAVGADPADEFPEILRLAEIAIDRGEAHIGDLVEAGQRLHDEAADDVARYLALARALELANHRVDDALDLLGLDRPLAQGDMDRAREFVALERLALPVLLDHRQLAQLDALEGGEARRAIRAEAAPTDRRAIVGRPR